MEPLTIAALALAPSLAVFIAGCGVALYRTARDRRRHAVSGSHFAADR